MTPRQLAKTPEGMKCCGKCQKEFPKNTDWFDKDSSKSDGFKNWCKKCRREKRQHAEMIQAAELMKKLDMAVVSNLAQAKPGGTAIPHAAEIYQNVMALMGGVQGFAMHWVSQYLAANPGSQTRERMLAGMQKLSQAVSDSNKVQMPVELMSDEDIDAEMKRREERMRIVPGTFVDVTDDKEPEQPDAGRDESAA